MEREFWLERWDLGQTRFHQERVHPDLERHGPAWLGDASRRVLVPLCGKSWDLPWLADRGHHTVGSEFSEIAARAVFAEHDREPRVSPQGEHVVYEHGTLAVWQGDFFALPEHLAPFDRVWDRAALVAVRPDQREAYVAKLAQLAPGGDLLLSALDYDPSAMSGPPFAVPPSEVERLFGPSGLGATVEKVDEHDLIEAGWRERGHDWFRSNLYRIGLPKSA